MRENHSPEDDKEAAEQVKSVAQKETYSEFSKSKKDKVPTFLAVETKKEETVPEF
tara:strand:+ start:307 stop:471 length:165 start_codon:yes stop_codon:yes gene_type:complete